MLPQVPAALEVDDTLSLALKGELRKGLALKNPARFQQLTQNSLIARSERPALRPIQLCGAVAALVFRNFSA